LANRRPKIARRKVQQAKDLADHSEFERNLAQQELVLSRRGTRIGEREASIRCAIGRIREVCLACPTRARAAHEINNPLLGILSHLELERKHASGDERTEVEQCIEGAKRISSAVRGLLDYARPGPLLLGKVSLFRLVGETLKFVEHQPMFRNLTLTNLVSLDLPLITADVNQLSQVLMNLLLNAAQATPAGGSITIMAELEQAAGIVELRITDSGSGIPADFLRHIFEPFFTTKRGKGTGLGLSMSQSCVRSHGGDIQVESVEGRGTTVRVTLPTRQPGRPAEEYSEIIA
jgi:signal transduction histidine kinase